MISIQENPSMGFVYLNAEAEKITQISGISRIRGYPKWTTDWISFLAILFFFFLPIKAPDLFPSHTKAIISSFLAY